MYSKTLYPTHGGAMGVTAIVIDSVLLSLATIAMSIRLYSRKLQRHSLLLNDYAAMLSWILVASLVITSNIVISRYGAGFHSVNQASLPNILKAYLAADVMWAVANTSIKISVVHFYITIFRSNKAFLVVAYVVITFVMALGVTIVVSDLSICHPLSLEWNLHQPRACNHRREFMIAFNSCNIATDIIIILLPMPLVWGLRMGTRRKMEVTVTFALGWLVCVVTVVRLFAQLKFKDYVNNIPVISILSTLEPMLAIIVACLPLFRPTIRKVASHIKGAKSETPNVLSSTMARLRLKRAKGSVFQRFDDSLLLTGLEDSKTQTNSTGPIGHGYSLEGDVPASETRIPPQSSIMVKQDLEVRSDEATSREETV